MTRETKESIKNEIHGLLNDLCTASRAVTYWTQKMHDWTETEENRATAKAAYEKAIKDERVRKNDIIDLMEFLAR